MPAAYDSQTKAKVVKLLSSGKRANEVIKNVDVSYGTVLNWAKEAGIELKRGRPKLKARAKK